MGSPAPLSSPSSPQPGSKHTAAFIVELPLPVDWDLLPKRRYCSVDGLMRRTRVVREYTYYANFLCEICGSGDRDDELLLCDSCDRGHHTFCLRPIVAQVPRGPWFCPVCAPPAKEPKSLPLNQTKIFNFDRIQKDEQDAKAAVSKFSQGGSIGFPLNQTDEQMDEQDEEKDERDAQITETRFSQDEQMDEQDEKDHLNKQKDEQDAQAAESRLSQGFPLNQTDGQDEEKDQQDEQKDEQDAQAAESRCSQGFPLNQMDEQDDEKDEQDAQAVEYRLSQGFPLNHTDEQMDEKDEQDAHAAESSISQVNYFIRDEPEFKDVCEDTSKICTPTVDTTIESSNKREIASSTIEKSNGKKTKRIHSGGLGTKKNNLEADDVSIELWNQFLAKRAVRKGFKIKGQSQPFIEICGYYITYDEFYDSFKARGYVSNNVMTLWSYQFNCDQLQLFEEGKTSNRKFAFSQHVTGYLSVDPASFNHEETCKKAYTKINKTFPFINMDLMFFPIVCANHWVLLCVSISMGKIAFFDSLSASKGTTYLKSAQNLILNFAATTTKYAFLEDDVSDFKWSFPPGYPKQKNLIDCGIYTMDYMEAWNGTEMGASSLENGTVLQYRKHAAQLLLKSAYNMVKLDDFMRKYNGKET